MLLDAREMKWLLVLLVLVVVGLARIPKVAVPAKLGTLPSASPSLHESTPASSAPTALPDASRDCSWLGIVIDNSIPARPQSGLSQASIVYEFPAEGGITRLLAFFCEGAPEVVGPVRSLRIYMLDLAREYGAVVAHSGQSASALEVISRGADPVINEFRQPQPFRRDARRRMPHNLYTSVPALRRYIQTLRASPGLRWATAELPAGPEPMTVSIPYGPGYDVQFVYDPATGTYRRTVDRRPAIDAATGAPIAVAGVIVQYVHWWQIYEDTILESRLDLVGTGPMSVFTGGQRVDGQWTRAAGPQPTVFADQDGHPLTLRQGPIWVNIVSSDRTIRVEHARPKWQAE